MSEYRTFKSQYFTFFAAIRPVTATMYASMDEPARDALYNKMQQVQASAYKKMEAVLPSIEGYRQNYTEGDMSYEVEQFELCADDVLLEERAGFMCFGMGFYSEQRVPDDVIENVKQAVVRAYAEAGALHAEHIELVAFERQKTETVNTTEVTVY